MTDDRPNEEAAGDSGAATLVLPREAAHGAAPGEIAIGPGSRRVAGRYDVLGLLGTGGMGAVYRARDVELDELVALKVLRRELAPSPAMLERFRQEVRLARRVTHRNVARTFDIGEHVGERFITMELVDGESLASLLARRGRLSLGEVAYIATEVLAGMAAAHAAGVVHRDLKPDNVLVAKDGRVVVTDFGIAYAGAVDDAVGKRQGGGAGMVGTPAYMAPEQVERAPDIDARADVYAFGAMLYELLTGSRAWPGEVPFVVAAARLLKPPPDPRVVVAGLPASVAAVLMQCMARVPADRFATAADVAMALRDAVSVATAENLEFAPTGPYSAVPQNTLKGEGPPRATAPSPPALDKTVAVLPFKNEGPPSDAYLAAGITDDLIDVLSMTRGLKVRPRGAIASLGQREPDPVQVGHELGVQMVVLGSVRRAEDTIRITARLTSAADGFQIWARHFDRPTGDLLGVNDEVASSIAEALTVVGRARPRVAPTDPEAIDLYLRAQHELSKFWREDAVVAVGLYEQALALSPKHPTILAGCARARVRVAFFGGAGAAEMLARAREAADRAVAGAPELGESWVALAAARRMGGDAEGAVRALVTALDRSEGLAPAHDMLGRLLLEAQGPIEAIPHLRTALAIDPSDLAPRFELARAHALLRQWDESSALLDLPAPGPSGERSRYVVRARVSLWRGAPHPEIVQAPLLGAETALFQQPAALNDFLRTRVLPQSMGDGLVADALAEQPGSRRRTLMHQFNAEVFSYQGALERSLEGIRGAIESGLYDIAWMDRCPALDAVRGAAAFAPLRAEVAARAARVVAALAASG